MRSCAETETERCNTSPSTSFLLAFAFSVIRYRGTGGNISPDSDKFSANFIVEFMRKKILYPTNC